MRCPSAAAAILPSSANDSGTPTLWLKRSCAIPQREIGDRAGLVAFADERHHYFLGLCQTADGAKLVVAVRNGAADPEEGRIIAAVPYSAAPHRAIRLRINARGADYAFSYAIADEDWQILLAHGDGRLLASEATNQFTGTLIGVYAARGATPSELSPSGRGARPNSGAPR